MENIPLSLEGKARGQRGSVSRGTMGKVGMLSVGHEEGIHELHTLWLAFSSHRTVQVEQL